jgi:hypothetical protein
VSRTPITTEDVLEPKQLDLFIDGRDAFLVHEVVTSLVARDADRAALGLVRLRIEHPSHPDLPALGLLVDHLCARPVVPATHATLAASVEAIERDVTLAARRVLGTHAAPFLRPSWEALAATAAGLPFDETYPRAHSAWIGQHYDDWSLVCEAIEAEADWLSTPVLRYWQGLARHHLGEPDAAIRLWLPLCWMDGALFARHAPALPSATLREAWETFERLVPFEDFLNESPDATAWFPAWLLVRRRNLARLFRAGDIPDAGAASHVFAALLVLVPLESRGLTDELVAQRRALRQLSPAFFRYYMEVVGGRRSAG